VVARERGYKACVGECVADALKHMWMKSLKGTIVHEMHVLSYIPSHHRHSAATNTSDDHKTSASSSITHRPVFSNADPKFTVTFTYLLLGDKPLPERNSTGSATPTSNTEQSVALPSSLSSSSA
jgi:hypothetical protein